MRHKRIAVSLLVVALLALSVSQLNAGGMVTLEGLMTALNNLTQKHDDLEESHAALEERVAELEEFREEFLSMASAHVPSVGFPGTPPQCEQPERFILPGQKVVGEESETLLGHIDLVSVSSSLEGEMLTVTFELAELPAELIFDRSGVQKDVLEYSWSASVVIGEEDDHYSYELQASHFVFSTDASRDKVVSIAEVAGQLQADVWESDIEGYGSMAISGASLEFSPTDNTLTLSGRIPGITGNSRLYFGAYDFLLGNDAISCHP
ncbi:MAG: hypothetical protein OXO50_21225 [Caldilineaceae bacterium]|nr:hypothetical protein [Caldilineaceae bacterium]